MLVRKYRPGKMVGAGRFAFLWKQVNSRLRDLPDKSSSNGKKVSRSCGRVGNPP